MLAPMIVGRTAHRRPVLRCGHVRDLLRLARRQVVGIEENASAVVEARGNARLNRVEERVRFVKAASKANSATKTAATALRAADIVFLDPPRKGSDEATLAALADAGVPQIWYLSCNPATLARDLRYLAGRAYEVGIVQPFDMFPQTGHVETLVTLTRR